VPQLRATGLMYPFNAVRLPLNCADELTVAVSDEFLILRT
jgi:hypothetical protein